MRPVFRDLANPELLKNVYMELLIIRVIQAIEYVNATGYFTDDGRGKTRHFSRISSELLSPISWGGYHLSPRISLESKNPNQLYKEEKSFVKEKKRKTSSKSSRKSDKKPPEKYCKFIKAPTKSRSEYMREYRARKKTLQNTLLMPSLMTYDRNAIETLKMTAQINMDFVNHRVPSTIELSTSLVRVETDSCESIINSILPYKDYDSLKKGSKKIFKSDSLIILSVTGVRFVTDYGLEMI
ncbi:uncharacterized protein TNCV_1580691 [Trichonephila clavipes]|nr:uncharacterized protein TNCV_1580691 [Trichonephila clavipes]